MKDNELMAITFSEFAYVLLFVALGAAALLFTRVNAARTELSFCYAQTEQLRSEVSGLNELLEETRYGVVPCWRRPERAVPPVSLAVVIESNGALRLGTPDRKPVDLGVGEAADETAVRQAVIALIAEQQAYAAERACYLRVTVENRTTDFVPYRRVTETLRAIGLVVVNA